jgi:hypothetical protein
LSHHHWHRGLLAAGGPEQGRIQEIYDAMAESSAIAHKLGLADVVSGVGAMLAQVMAMGGLRDEALAVLDQAEAAFAKLGDARGVAHVRTLRKQIAAMPPRSRTSGHQR